MKVQVEVSGFHGNGLCVRLRCLHEARVEVEVSGGLGWVDHVETVAGLMVPFATSSSHFASCSKPASRHRSAGTCPSCE